METITEKLTYRIYEDKDLDGILDLWEQYSGWGAITREQFKTWHFKTPLGSCLIIVAVNEFEKIIGQIVFSPSVVVINGKEVKAYRISAPILNTECRQLSINHADHPAFNMIRFGMEIGRKRGYKIDYAFPAQGWAVLMKAFPKYGLPNIHFALYSCFVLSLDGADYQPDEDMRINNSQQPFSREYDQLWEEAVELFPILCGVKRNAAWLDWKISRHLVFEFRHTHSNELNGYIAINKQSGLIVDMLAKTKKDMNRLIRAVVNLLHISNSTRYPLGVKKLTGMLTPTIESCLQNVSYEKEHFTFAFGCYPLENSIFNEDIHPSKWYMMPND